MSAALDIRRVGSAVGAEIVNIDLVACRDEAVYAAIRAAIDAHGVVFFRDQHLTSAQYADFARHFGMPTVPTSDIIPALEGSREIAVVRKEPGAGRNIGGNWHTDQSFRAEPSWGTMLLAREVPASGGDTLFASMSAAYEALSDGLKQTLRGLNAVHSNATVQARMTGGRPAAPPTVHPVVARHPAGGRPILYVNPAFTSRFEGWTEAESRPLLDFLFRHAQRPEFSCRFRWRPGSLAFWDNLQTWHYAVNDYGDDERLMHRIVVVGPSFA